MAKGIPVQWFASETQENKEIIKKTLESDKIILDKLSKMLYNMYIENRDIVHKDYDCPSWSHKQAHLNGFLECLRKVQDLITFEDRQ